MGLGHLPKKDMEISNANTKMPLERDFSRFAPLEADCKPKVIFKDPSGNKLDNIALRVRSGLIGLIEQSLRHSSAALRTL